MSTHPTPLPASEATEHPVGLVFDVRFDAFSARLTTLPDQRLRFEIPEGPYARTETVEIATTPIRPGLFLVSWVEAGGATVVHLEDFARGHLFSHATLPDGSFLRMDAPLVVAGPERGR